MGNRSRNLNLNVHIFQQKRLNKKRKRPVVKKEPKNKQPNKKRWIPTVCLNHMMWLDKSREDEGQINYHLIEIGS